MLPRRAQRLRLMAPLGSPQDSPRDLPRCSRAASPLAVPAPSRVVSRAVHLVHSPRLYLRDNPALNRALCQAHSRRRSLRCSRVRSLRRCLLCSQVLSQRVCRVHSRAASRRLSQALSRLLNQVASLAVGPQVSHRANPAPNLVANPVDLLPGSRAHSLAVNQVANPACHLRASPRANRLVSLPLYPLVRLDSPRRNLVDSLQCSRRHSPVRSRLINLVLSLVLNLRVYQVRSRVLSRVSSLARNQPRYLRVNLHRSLRVCPQGSPPWPLRAPRGSQRACRVLSRVSCQRVIPVVSQPVSRALSLQINPHLSLVDSQPLHLLLCLPTRRAYPHLCQRALPASPLASHPCSPPLYQRRIFVRRL